MNEKKVLPVITDKDVENNGVQKLADRPNRSNQYGKSGLSAQGLKEWFDKLAQMLAANTREVSAAISGENATGEYIAISLDTGYDNLSALVAAMLSGAFASEVLKLYPDANKEKLESLQGVIDGFAKLLNGDKDTKNSVRYFIAAAVADLIGGEQDEDTSAYKTLKTLYNALGDLKTLVGESLPKGVADVITYINSVELALAYEITNRGEAITDALATAQQYAAAAVRMPAYDEKSGKITFTTLAGDSKTHDLPIEKILDSVELSEDKSAFIFEFHNSEPLTVPLGHITLPAWVKDIEAASTEEMLIPPNTEAVKNALLSKTAVKVDGVVQSEWDATGITVTNNKTYNLVAILKANNGGLAGYAAINPNSPQASTFPVRTVTGAIHGNTSDTDADTVLVNKAYLRANTPSSENSSSAPVALIKLQNNGGWGTKSITTNAGNYSIAAHDGDGYLRAKTSESKDDSTMLTNKTWVNARLKELQETLLGGDVEDALNTLKELAAALGNDPNFATTMIAKHNEMEARLNKVDKFTADDVNKFVVVGADGELTAVEIATGGSY